MLSDEWCKGIRHRSVILASRANHPGSGSLGRLQVMIEERLERGEELSTQSVGSRHCWAMRQVAKEATVT